MRNFIACIFALAGAAHLSAAERTDKILIQGNAAGTQTVQQEPGGAVRAEYSYNDRGRGDHIVATWKLDADGLPIEYEGRGNDYMKAPVEERFEFKNGQASWKNRSEQGEAGDLRQGVLSADKRAAGIPGGACARFAKAPDHKLALLPAGEASIEEAGKASLASGKGDLTRVPHYGSWLFPAIDLARPRR